MHIPDGYLSPQTYAPAYGVMGLIWVAVSARLKQTLSEKQIPLLALSAAFVFVIMMFNIPLPGGSTGHATGAVLVAILLGPSAACIAVTIALALQAVLFGDGGVTAIGANCLNMAFVAPFVGFGVYKLLGGTRKEECWFRPIAAGIAGYIGLNTAALLLAFEMGIQPLIAHDSTGHALYAPYPLQTAVPVVMVWHLLVFGVVEAIATGMVVAYLRKVEPGLLGIQTNSVTSTLPGLKKLWIGILALIILCPLGLIIPAKLGAGSAWGEWSAGEIRRLIGYVPAQLEKLSDMWKSPFPEYALKGQNSNNLASASGSYILSAVIGIAAVCLAAFLLGNLLRGKWKRKLPSRITGAFLEALQREIAAEESASKPGFLQRIDPRAKLVSIILLLIATSAVTSAPILAASLAASIVLMTVSRVSPARALAALVPPVAVSAAIILPAMLNIITPGPALAHLGHGGNLLGWRLPETITITEPGALVAIRFLLRAAACVSWVIALTLTTKFQVLLSALKSIGLPRVFTITLLMMHRYIFALIQYAEDLRLARESRTISRERTMEGDRRAAAGMGQLFQTSRRLGDQVYLAMSARGFSGEARTLAAGKLGFRDIAAAIAATAVSLGLIMIDKALLG
ncbi:MAG: cobalt transporter CbiM [Armatimonadota bacterium]|nr:cobalt transporter CbiM [Armatimonadota bacterium]